MKKFLLLVVSVLLLQTIHAQSFDKSSLVISANYGLDGYTIKEHTVNKVTNSDSNSKGGAAATNFNLGIEYGLFKWLGIGLQFKLDNYIHNDTSVTSAIGFEVGAIVNLHLVRTKHFNLLIGGDFGFSNLTINLPTNNYQIYGNGTWADVHITPRFYFGRFGLNFNLYLPLINYPNLTTNVQSYNEYIASSWNANGFGATVGIQYRILN
jgi:opacity protein-like surface antigen